MIMALTVWENRISPVFDSAGKLLIVDVEKDSVINRCYKLFHSELPSTRAVILFDLQVKVLICGAISHLFSNIIEAYGIHLIPFIAGDVDQVLEHYLKGTLFTANFLMPGCRHRGRHGRGYLKQGCKKKGRR